VRFHSGFAGKPSPTENDSALRGHYYNEARSAGTGHCKVGCYRD
jgi:hypothetical protein